MRRSSPAARLRRLCDQVLEAPDLDALARLLAGSLPEALRVASAALLVWDRKLEAFESLAPGEARVRAVRPGGPGVAAPETRYLIADGHLIETRASAGEGVLVPLMARAGLAGVLVLGPRQGRRRVPYTPIEARLLSRLAARAALSLENAFYQRELIASERITALGSMAGMLAHDLRGPMTVIRGYAETLAEGAHSDAEVRERARIIVEQIDRLERMTSETLDFARGGGRLALVRVDLSVQLAEWAHGLAEQLPGLWVERELRLPPGTQALVDPDKLRRALVNLAANAHEAMGGRGRLLLRAGLEDAPSGAPLLVLDVWDEGPGVPPEVRTRLFEPFVTHGKPHGTGLGLSVTRRFVEDHGGSVELLPEGPGARFRLRLPLRPAP